MTPASEHPSVRPGRRGMITWFVDHPVAANLFMACIFVFGLLSAMTIRKEFFPEVKTGWVMIEIEYPDASPQLIEKQVVLPVESALTGVNGINQTVSHAFEGLALLEIKPEPGFAISELTSRIRTRINEINTFPSAIKNKRVFESLIKDEVAWVILSGDMDDESMKALARKLRDDMVADPDISLVQIDGIKSSIISIEVSPFILEKYDITLDDISRAIQESSLEVPAGILKSTHQDILIRAGSQASALSEFEDILLFSHEGTPVYLKDIATVRRTTRDNFFFRFNGKPCVGLQVFRIGKQDFLTVSEAMTRFVEQKQQELPQGISITQAVEGSPILKSTLKVMVKNLVIGGILVFILLSAFLRPRVAFWVMIGIPFSFLGAIWLMTLPMFNISLNIITLFGFILVIGIIVDDAIVVGESIYQAGLEGHDGPSAAVKGTLKVLVPVTFGVLTTMAAFSPMLGMKGVEGKIFFQMGIVVILTLAFSLVESKLILPRHLSHGNISPGQGRIARSMTWMAQRIYRPVLEKSLAYRYLTLSLFAAVLITFTGLMAYEHIKIVFMPDVETGVISARLKMTGGTTSEELLKATQQIEQAARAVNHHDPGIPGGSGRAHASQPPIRHYLSFNTSQTEALAYAELVPASQRSLSSVELARMWRERTGTLPGAMTLEFTGTESDTGAPISFILKGKDLSRLKQAAEELKQELLQYQGVSEIADTFIPGKDELKIKARPSSWFSNISIADIAYKIRSAFHGIETQSLLTGQEDVKVVVQLPEACRKTAGTLDNLTIKSGNGRRILFRQMAHMETGKGYAHILHKDGQTFIEVSADVDKSRQNPQKIMDHISHTFLPGLLERYPDLTHDLGGEAKESRQSKKSMIKGFAYALLGIFALMAIPLSSYAQPFIIMTAIPFGIIGAVIGHVVMGLDLSIWSGMGVIALSGVVVNDSLVMTDFINQQKKKSTDLYHAVSQAGVARFRPIMLTTITTFSGLLPMLFEKSFEAQFLKPMSVSLGFGIVFATLITLFLVPCLYMAGSDITTVYLNLRRKKAC